MERKLLFPGKLEAIVHGGDYNAEQWLDRPDILEEDVRLMKQAGMNCATLGVFAWSVLEPREGEYHLDWLEQIMDRLYENGIYTVLATPSGARPAWLDEKYPEAMRVASDGRRNHHGVRHNHCMSSPVYRQKVEEVVRRLAGRLGGHPGLILWHISNELGGECWCDKCRGRFTEFLRSRYDGDIDKLNHEWWTTFWSHRYNRFEQVEPPWPNGETSVHGLNLDWKRFTTWNMNDYMMFEAELLRGLTPGVPITTNFMTLYNGLDYHVMEKGLDIISWDSYPTWGDDSQTLWGTAAETAFNHSVMRSMKRDRPFMLMESVPSLVNWHPYNKLKRPGIHRLSALQAVACGADSVQYFQWRKGRGSYEQFHGAVMDHLSRSDTRVFREVAEVGGMLHKLNAVCGSTTQSPAAILFDWDNRWAIADMAGLSKAKKQYEETCRAAYALLMKNGVDCDVVPPGADLSRYGLVYAPMLYMLKPGVAAGLARYVENGGQLVATYLTGYVNESTLCWLGGFPGDGLTGLFGLYTEEIDTLYPTDRNAVRFEGALAGTFEARDFCEIIKNQSAEVLGAYTEDFYAGTPAVTRKHTGAGIAWYVGARLEDDGLEAVLKAALDAAGVAASTPPQGVERHLRMADGTYYEFWLNWTDTEQTVQPIAGTELLTEADVNGLLTLPPLGAAVVCG